MADKQSRHHAYRIVTDPNMTPEQKLQALDALPDRAQIEGTRVVYPWETETPQAVPTGAPEAKAIRDTTVQYPEHLMHLADQARAAGISPDELARAHAAMAQFTPADAQRYTRDVAASKVPTGNAEAAAIRGTNAEYPMATDRNVGTGKYMPGRMHLDPALAPQVPSGSPRPFAPGEYVRNPDGSWSSEVSMTVQDPSFNGGRATNIPSMWLKDGKPYLASDEGEAVRYARSSGLPFHGYRSIEEADKAATDRESAWQPLKRPEDARRIEPLWDPGGKAARVQATPLVFSSENGGNFRTPDEQIQYVDSVKKRPAPTPLFFGEDNGGTFRTPDEQIARVNTLKSRPEPTPLFFDSAGEGTFRDPYEQIDYAEQLRDPSLTPPPAEPSRLAIAAGRAPR